MSEVWGDPGEVKGLMLAIARTINDYYGVDLVSREVVENERELAAEIESQRVAAPANEDARVSRYDAVEEELESTQTNNAMSDNPVQDRVEELMKLTVPQIEKQYAEIGGTEPLVGPKAEKAKQLAQFEAIIGSQGSAEDTIDLSSMSKEELYRLDIVVLRGYLRDNGVQIDNKMDIDTLVPLILNPSESANTEDDEDAEITWEEIEAMDTDSLRVIANEVGIENPNSKTRKDILSELEAMVE